jgi:hypothetical protein
MFKRLRRYFWLFAALTLIYHANLRPVDSGDTLPASLIPFAILLDHTVALDRFAPWLKAHVWFAPSVLHASHGHYFSFYPIGTPLLACPFYAPLAIILRHWDVESVVVVARIAGKCAAAAVTALSAVVLLVLLKRITSEGWAWGLTLVYALGTETWSVSSQALWQHGPAELAVAGALLSLDYWTEHRAANPLWWSGICIAAALIIRPTCLALLPAFIVAMVLAKATVPQYLRLLAAPILAGVLQASYNWYVFHNLSGGYGTVYHTASFAASLAGLFASPARGLLVYTPVVLFAILAFAPAAATLRSRHLPLVSASFLFVVLYTGVTAAWPMWWGGYSWGPRVLTELAPPLVVLMAIGASAMHRSWTRRTFAALAAYSIFVQAIGAFFYPKGHWDAGPPSVDAAPARLWNWRDNPIGRTVSGGPYWEAYAIVGAAIYGGIPAARRRMQELHLNPIEQSEPPTSSDQASSERGLP